LQFPGGLRPAGATVAPFLPGWENDGMMRASTCVILLLPLSLGGCRGSIEQPIDERDWLRQSQAERLRLREGKTTVDEVRQVMGGADYLNEDRTFVAYYWETIGTPQPLGGITDADDFDSMRKYTRNVLALRFDEQGVLERYRHRRLKASDDLGRQLDSLAHKWGVATPVPADRAAEHGAVPAAGRTPAASGGPR
jgi:hypothetical protein